MSEELKVEPAVLTQAANGINSIIGQLSDLGIKETGAMGRGFALLALSPLQAGKASVQSTFETFCNRWSWGVRSLVQSANTMAQAVGLAAGRYQMMDDQAKNALKEVYSHLFSNPHLTKDQIDKRSLSETLSDNPFNALAHPDYSAESFQKMSDQMQLDAQVIKTVAPQAAANIGALANPATVVVPTPGTTAPGWNTGALQQAAQILTPETGGANGGKAGK
ncbi:hypothetical protein D7D52_37010 [Nocardia yunnanensis]|uniref:Uncharacterized protein n=1 Tax=Nocardia yunnanensis TaxID=2382165 RepID=A0A386ZMF3_9NOCA|nr:hypothetical protein [Nocardia yunnanensis]AYF78503.1 hypothetical protein D7D52_37010 [Nocardia yunnanensis]